MSISLNAHRIVSVTARKDDGEGHARWIELTCKSNSGEELEINLFFNDESLGLRDRLFKAIQGIG